MAERQNAGRRARPRDIQDSDTLREVARTAPYMHDGSLTTLTDVVEFYSEGGRKNPSLDSDIRPLRLTDDEKRVLIMFLESLSGNIRDGNR